MCHTGPHIVPTAQRSLCHHPFPGHGKCQGRDGFWGAGWGARCAHPPVLQSAKSPPHTHPMSLANTQCPPRIPLHHWCSASLATSLMPGARAEKAVPQPPQHCLLPVWLCPHSRAAAPFGPGISSPGGNGKGSELSSALIPALGLSTFCDTTPEQPQEGKLW